MRSVVGFDAIHGRYEISEPVVVDIIHASSLQRLKGISQSGMPPGMLHRSYFTRYDHSVGVFLLLRKLGASLEEQVDGLLHDVSHTAFSHVIDHIVGTGKNEDFQDQNHRAFIMRSELPDILARYGIEPDNVIHNPAHTLLEQELPALCADRVDYALRTIATEIEPAAVPMLRDSVIAYDGRMMFSNASAAKIFGTDYLECQTRLWGGVDDNVRFHILAAALKSALDDGVIIFDDFFHDDAAVLQKIGRSGHRSNLLFDALRGDISYVEREDGAVRLKKKFRYVDPEFLENGEVHRASEHSSYELLLSEARAINERGISFDLLYPALE